MHSELYIYDEIFYYKEVIKDPQAIVDKINKLDQPWIFYPTKPFSAKMHKLNPYEFTEYKNVTLKDIGYEVSSCIDHYVTKNNIKITNFTDVVVNKAYPGKRLGEHVDSYDRDSSPSISIIIDLNDDYAGGELIFPNQNANIKSKAGSVIIYPSFDPYYHIPSVITSGSKISGIMFGFE